MQKFLTKVQGWLTMTRNILHPQNNNTCACWSSMFRRFCWNRHKLHNRKRVKEPSNSKKKLPRLNCFNWRATKSCSMNLSHPKIDDTIASSKVAPSTPPPPNRRKAGFWAVTIMSKSFLLRSLRKNQPPLTNKFRFSRRHSILRHDVGMEWR